MGHWGEIVTDCRLNLDQANRHLGRVATGGLPVVTEYQVRQTERGASIFIQAAGSPHLAPVREAIRAGLARLGLRVPEVTITVLDRLDRGAATGKVARFIARAT